MQWGRGLNSAALKTTAASPLPHAPAVRLVAAGIELDETTANMTVEEYLQHYLATMTERAKVSWCLQPAARARGCGGSQLQVLLGAPTAGRTHSGAHPQLSVPTTGRTHSWARPQPTSTPITAAVTCPRPPPPPSPPSPGGDRRRHRRHRAAAQAPPRGAAQPAAHAQGGAGRQEQSGCVVARPRAGQRAAQPRAPRRCHHASLPPTPPHPTLPPPPALALQAGRRCGTCS